MDETNSQEQSSPEKLQIDDPNNFQFHAAYLVYAELFDNMNEEEGKRELNKNIEALVKQEITVCHILGMKYYGCVGFGENVPPGCLVFRCYHQQ